MFLSLVLLWLLSTQPVRNILTASLEHQYPAFSLSNKPISSRPTAIVLLGGGIQEKALDYQGQDTLSHHSWMRTLYAAKIAKEIDLPIYATGGTPLTTTGQAEAEIMEKKLIWLGINKTNIHTENQANTTWDNAVLTKPILDTNNIKTIVLITSALHMPRSVWCFEMQGIKVISAPTDYLTEQKDYDLRSFLPRWNVLSDSSAALHEYLGYYWYKLKYSYK
ncbi:MAG: YdcF family protein [Ghiorsea sp.]